MNRVLFLFLSIFSSAFTLAQKTLTLEQCIDNAINNSIPVKQSDLQVLATEINYKQAKTNIFPTVNGNISQGINQGRSIDPYTNTYVNNQVNYTNYELNSNILLFNGFRLQNNILQNRYALNASKMELQQVKDNLTLNIILAYLQVLNNEDLVELSKKQVLVSQKQIDRLEILNQQGAINPPQLYDLKGQLKNDELTIVNNQNALASSKLALFQLMNMPFDPLIQLERINVNDLLSFSPTSFQETFSKAVDQLAIVKAAQLRRKSAEAALKTIKSNMFPSLYLNNNLNTRYSSAAKQEIFVSSNEAETGGYIFINGNKVPVMSKQNNYNFQKIPYNNQLKNNFFSNVNLSLSIPIFNQLQSRNSIRLARIEVKNNFLVEENTKIQLRQEVEQAHLNMNNAWERYKILLEQVAAYAESFRAAEVRFNSGVGNSVDYLIAKNNRDRSNINLLIAKYDFVLRKKVVDYYKGTFSK